MAKRNLQRSAKKCLDVRAQDEFSQGHITNATLIDHYRTDFGQQINKINKNKPVFVYCKAGARSESAAEVLADLGLIRYMTYRVASLPGIRLGKQFQNKERSNK